MDKEIFMADNVEITINSRTKFAGRLIGAIDAQECRAVLNVEDAARKIYSAESVTLEDIQPVAHKRFVVATSNYSSDHRREVFISPIVQYVSYLHDKRLYHCADNNEYNIKDI
jgi:hypothetical protein